MTDSAEAILSAAFVRGRSGRKAKSSFQVIVEVFVVSLGMSGEDCRRYLETGQVVCDTAFGVSPNVVLLSSAIHHPSSLSFR
jgi:hypothetical protein